MTFLLIMTGGSYVRDAICSLICSQMEEVQIITAESPEEVANLPAEEIRDLKLVLFHVGEQEAGSSHVRADLQAIGARLNGTPIVLLGQRCERSQSIRAIQSGARGYISAETPAEIIKHALPLVAGGGVFAPPFLYGCLRWGDTNLEIRPASLNSRGAELLTAISSEAYDAASDLDEELAIFTDREIEVLRLLAAGLPNKLIAYRLNLKEGTVKVHMRNLLKKLNVGSRTQAALFASRHFELEEQAK